jgi:hypothetical protein
MPYFLAPIWKTTLDSLSNEELWVHFEKCLKAYDWYYSTTDDHGVWRAGEEQNEHLQAVSDRVRELDRERADRIYCKACPWLNEDGSRADGL